MDSPDAALQEAVAEVDALRRPPGVLPGCVVRAMLGAPRVSVQGVTLGELTLEGWFRLEAASSGLLPWNAWPEGTDERMQELVLGLQVLAGETDATRAIGRIGGGAAEVLRTMRERVAAAFETEIRMRKPSEGLGADLLEDTAGFGEAAPVIVAVMADLGATEDAARSMPVARALFLLACARWREGYVPDDKGWRGGMS